MWKDDEIIKGCCKNKKSAQLALYEKYAPVLRSICYRYASNSADADDILHDGFIKIFTKIRQFKNKGSFEGWLKRIMVNTALSLHAEKQKKGYAYNLEDIHDKISIDEEFTEIKNNEISDLYNITKDDLIKIMQKLPAGYKLVFNLYVFEDYSHNEIAEQLNISVNTSKSQLSRARKQLQRLLLDYYKIDNDKR